MGTVARHLCGVERVQAGEPDRQSSDGDGRLTVCVDPAARPMLYLLGVPRPNSSFASRASTATAATRRWLCTRVAHDRVHLRSGNTPGCVHR